jgi:hypothetical protein
LRSLGRSEAALVARSSFEALKGIRTAKTRSSSAIVPKIVIELELGSLFCPGEEFSHGFIDAH